MPHQRNPHQPAVDLVPAHLLHAYTWIASVGEWPLAIGDCNYYAKLAAPRAGGIAEAELHEVICWRAPKVAEI